MMKWIRANTTTRAEVWSVVWEDMRGYLRAYGGQTTWTQVLYRVVRFKGKVIWKIELDREVEAPLFILISRCTVGDSGYCDGRTMITRLEGRLKELRGEPLNNYYVCS